MREYPTPEPGQVWADNDWRSKGRTVRVEEVTERYVYVEVLTDRKTAVQPTVGRKVRLLRSRMRPTSTGYRLVAPSPAGER